MMGVHHAREWPSGEHAIEWAYELINGFKDGDKRIRRIVKRSRTIIVPIVNPDGFETSREAGELEGGGGGRGGDDTQETINIVSHPVRVPAQELPPASTTASRATALQPVASAWRAAASTPTATTAASGAAPARAPTRPPRTTAAPAPFSEPETRNIKRLVSRNQVTTLITNHTFSELVLRPPGIQSQGPPPRRDDLQEARRLDGGRERLHEPAAPTSSTTPPAAPRTGRYYATGGLGFTFEIG